MSIIIPFDFGNESRTTGFENARIVVLFVAGGGVTDLGRGHGPLAVADAGQYAEFYEMIGDFAPFDAGVCTEIMGGKDAGESAAKRAAHAMTQAKIPIIVSNSKDPDFAGEEVPRVSILTESNPLVLGDEKVPVHLCIDFEAFDYRGVSQGRGFTWYELMDAIESVPSGPGLVSAGLTGTRLIAPKTPPALYGAEILIKLIGFIGRGMTN